MPESHEILLSARQVHTGTNQPADAVLIRDGLIAATGSRADLQRLAPGARRIDYAGATITPGLVDAHVHLTEWALTRAQTDLSHTSSPSDAVARIAGAAPSADGWLRGRGWSAHDWNGAEPHRSVIDAVVSDRPVALQSHDMHSLWLNSVALSQADIDNSTPDPEGGRIVRDAAGEPTGLLLENAAQLVMHHMSAPTERETMDAVIQAQGTLHRLGFTGVHSFPGIHIPNPDPFVILQRMFECDVMRLRTIQHISVDKLDAAIQIGVRSGLGNDWIRVGGVKMFMDGALGSRTAWMHEPYEGGSNDCGVCVLKRDELREIVERAARAGIACTIHAIGDAAVSVALDELSPVSRRVEALPHRIEHVQCCPPSRYADFAKAGVICSVQPCHLMSDWAAADRHWGARSRHTYAFRSLLDNGAVLAFGSDAPVEPIDPRRGMFAAVTRQDDAFAPATGWYPEERLTAREALTAFTVGPALAAGTADRQGRLASGYWADIAVWDTDPLAAEPAELLDMNCIATFVGGELVFS